jgi:glycosyltransferase domain-containing protein
MKLKDKFTLVITVHERKEFIYNLLNYYTNFPCDIIVADSSEDSIDVSNYGVGLFHTPGALYYEKMCNVLDGVGTPFVLELADDDVIYKDAIIECVEFLEDHDDYVFAEGRWKDHYHKQTDYFLEYNFFSHDPIERVKVCLNKHWKAPNHSVVRTDVLRDNYRFQFENEVLWPVRWYDKIWMFLACFEGNYKALPVLYGERRQERLFDRLGSSYPEDLKKDVMWEDILKGDSLKPLVNFLTSRGYDRQFSEKFVREIAEGVPK